MWAAPHLQAHFPKSALAAPALLGSSLPKALGEHSTVPGAHQLCSLKKWFTPTVPARPLVQEHGSCGRRQGPLLVIFSNPDFYYRNNNNAVLFVICLFWHKRSWVLLYLHKIITQILFTWKVILFKYMCCFYLHLYFVHLSTLSQVFCDQPSSSYSEMIILNK